MLTIFFPNQALALTFKSDVNQSIQYREATSQRLPTIFWSLRRPPRLRSVGAASGDDQDLVPQEQATPIYRDDTITIGSLHQFALVSATRAPCNTTRRRNLVELKLELKKFERKVLNSPRSAQL